jgi:hypothetical protein
MKGWAMCRNHPDSNRRDPFICENAIKKQASLDFASFFIAFRFSHFYFTVLNFVSFVQAKEKKESIFSVPTNLKISKIHCI